VSSLLYNDRAPVLESRGELFERNREQVFSSVMFDIRQSTTSGFVFRTDGLYQEAAGRFLERSLKSIFYFAEEM